MAKRIEPVKCYAVVGTVTGIMPWSSSTSRRCCIKGASEAFGDPWKKLYRRGFRCVPVTITPVKKEKR